MLVFHGSIEVVSDPVCDYNDRDDLDFGYGFYVTDCREDAEMWAQAKAEEARMRHGVISYYVLDDDYVYDSGYLEFEDTDNAWFDFLDHCRCGDPTYKQSLYQIVEGEVADDSGSDIFEDYYNGEITREDALDQLSDMELGHQICFRTDDAIFRYLHYQESEQVRA